MNRLVVALATCTLLLAVLTEQVIAHGPLTALDHPVERFAVTHRSISMTDVMRLLSDVGSTSFLFPLVLMAVVYFVFRDRAWKPPAVLAAAFISDILLQDLVKAAVGRHRPPLSQMIGRYPGASFPSGHTTQSLVVYGMIALLLIRTHPRWPRVAVLLPAVCLVLLIGISRVYLGAHWPTDVAGGLLLGSFWLLVLHALFPFLLPNRMPTTTRGRSEAPNTQERAQLRDST
jgi:membrane-associated phospholipid phosphatase